MSAPFHLVEQFAASHWKLRRGRVWCTVCGHTHAVNSAIGLAHGWPVHCGVTMTIDSPEERAHGR